jgi:5'(3')-deoxyribonucleotidase
MHHEWMADGKRKIEMRLGIDLDGVVANFIKGWMLRYNTEFGTHLTEDQVDHWDSAGELTHFEDLADFWQWAGASGHGPSVFRNLEPYPGAIDALCQLATCHDIVILSMKCDWAAADTYSWIGDHHLPTREIHLLRDKWKVDCDIYLDDSPFALQALAKHKSDAIICRYVRPWNEAIPGVVDVAGWDEFLDFVAQEMGDRECSKRV